MSEIRIENDPEKLGQESDSGVIYLLAPGIEVNELLDSAASDVCRSAEDVRSRSDSSHVVVPDFYRLHSELLRAESQSRSNLANFEQFLATEPYPTLCLSPREFDWLLTAEDLQEILPLEEYDIIFVQYDTEAAERIVADRYSDVAEVDSEVLDRLRYNYQFDSSVLPDDSFETQLPFLLPTVGRMLSNNADGVIFPDAVETTSRISIREITESIASGELADRITSATDQGLPSIKTLRNAIEEAGPDQSSLLQQLRNTIPSALGGACGAGLASTAGSIALPFVVYLFLHKRSQRREEQEFYDRFGIIFDNRLLPPTVTKLEERLGLPPRTLEAIHNLSRPETHQQLTRIIEEIDPAEIEVFRQTLAEHDETIKNVSEEVGELESRLERLEGFVDSVIASGVDDLASLEEDVLGIEARVLDRERIEPEEFVFVGAFPQMIREAITESNLVIVTGVAGRGKTAAIYRALDRLEANGEYAARVPKLRSAGEEFIKHGIKATDGREPVIVSEFEGPKGVQDRGDLQTLLSIHDSLDATLLIECRRESLERFRSLTPRGLHPQSTPLANLESARQVEAPALDEGDVQECIKAVSQQLGLDSKHLDIEFPRNASETNGLLAKLAITRIVTAGTLDGQFDQIINESLGSFIQEFEKGSLEYKLVRLLSITGPVSEEVIRDVYGVSYADLADTKEQLQEYLTLSDNQLTLRPALLHGVLLRQEFTGHIEATARDLVECNRPEILPGIVANVTASYEFASTSESDQTHQELLHKLPEQIGRVADHARTSEAPERYIDCLDAAFGIPVPTRLIQIEELIDWLSFIRESDYDTPQEIAQEHAVTAGPGQGRAVSLTTAILGIGNGYNRSRSHSVVEFLVFLADFAEAMQQWIENLDYSVGDFMHLTLTQDLFEGVLGSVFLYPNRVDKPISEWYEPLQRVQRELAVIKNYGRGDLPETWPEQVLGGAVGQAFCLGALLADADTLDQNELLGQIEDLVIDRGSGVSRSYFTGLFARLNAYNADGLLHPVLDAMLAHWAEKSSQGFSQRALGTIGATYLDGLNKTPSIQTTTVEPDRKREALNYVLNRIEQYSSDEEWNGTNELFAQLLNSQGGPGLLHNSYESEWVVLAADVATEYGVGPDFFEVAIVDALIPLPSREVKEAQLLLPNDGADSGTPLQSTGPYELFRNTFEDEHAPETVNAAYILTAQTALAYPNRLSLAVDRLGEDFAALEDTQIVLFGLDEEPNMSDIEDIPLRQKAPVDLMDVRESLISFENDALSEDNKGVLLSILFGTIASGKSSPQNSFYNSCQRPPLEIASFIVTSSTIPLSTITWLLDRPDALVDIVVGAYTSKQHGNSALESVAMVLDELLERVEEENAQHLDEVLANRFEELLEDSPGIFDELVEVMDNPTPTHFDVEN